MLRSSTLLGGFAIAIAALTGCGESGLILPGDATPAELQIVGGNEQFGAAGAALGDSLAVRVFDDRGNPLPGHTVAFALDTEAPGAQVAPETTTSRSDGTARTSWVLGATSGTQQVVARVERDGAEPLEVTFIATVGSAPAQQIAAAAGNEQSAPAGGRLANPLVVLVTDGFGNPVAGVEVEWNTPAGSVDPESSVSGSDGTASTSWTLANSTGSQSATAAVEGLAGSPVTFTATAIAGSPTRLLLVSGNNQSAPAGSELPDPLVVRLLDDAGNGVPNRAVSWVVATGGGSVSSPSNTTGSDGRASIRWTLGPEPGPNTLNAVVSGVGVVAFAATAAGSGGGGGGGGGSEPDRLRFRVQPSDTEEDRTMSPRVEVEVLDQGGRVVTDREFAIKLELLDDRDRVQAEGTVTTRSGVATFTIRISRRGDYRLRASTTGLSSILSREFEISRRDRDDDDDDD